MIKNLIKNDSTFGNYTLNDCSSTANLLHVSNTGAGTDWTPTPEISYGPKLRRFDLGGMDNFKLETEVKEEKPKMTKRTRGLYQVILVDPKKGEIISNTYVICSKQEDVLLESNAGAKIKEKNLSISDVDKIVNFMGEIRKTKKNKDGEVEIVTEGE